MKHLSIALLIVSVSSSDAADVTWPPALRGAVDGAVTITTDEFLKVPAAVEQRRMEKFSCTLNNGGKAGDAKYGFNDSLPGGQI